MLNFLPTTLPASLETVLLLLAALLLHSTRLSWPLRWAETFYHEVSHGLACLITGGRVVGLRLDWNGGGQCTTRGGSRFLILISGYLGASLWGAALFLIGLQLDDDAVRRWLLLELGLLLFALLLWARSFSTIIILLLIAMVYAAAFFLPATIGLSHVLQVMGIFVMLNALAAPTYLIDGQHVGDGADLANLTIIIPEIIWVAFWFITAAAILGACLWWKAFDTVPFVSL